MYITLIIIILLILAYYVLNAWFLWDFFADGFKWLKSAFNGTPRISGFIIEVEPSCAIGVEQVYRRMHINTALHELFSSNIGLKFSAHPVAIESMLHSIKLENPHYLITIAGEPWKGRESQQISKLIKQSSPTPRAYITGIHIRQK